MKVNTALAEAYRREARAYFTGIHLPGFCHYDDTRIRRELKIHF